MRRNTIIMGAGGRDFHNFNVYFRNNPNYNVVAFTAAQIPYLEGRIYPPELSGPLYPKGIPIYSERELPQLISKYDVKDVFFCYSDVSYEYVMRKCAAINAAGAAFHLLGPEDTMLKSSLPVIAIVAIRTGSGKSPVSRYISKIMRDLGYNVGIIRHPMAYGDLSGKKAMRLTSIEDLDSYPLTIEEKEDLEPHLRNKFKVYAGVDYNLVLKIAEKENDILIWDGGNNDYPFIRPNLYITVVDPFRYDHMDRYYPSGINIRLADIIVITKVNTAPKGLIEKSKVEIRKYNSNAVITMARLTPTADKDINIKGKKVLVIEDGPTVTHGEMPYGIGYLYALEKGARILDARSYAKGSIKRIYSKYNHIKKVLPAVGYSEKQISELVDIINSSPADYIISATPTRLDRYLDVNKEMIHITYEIEDLNDKLKENVINKFLSRTSS